MMDTEKRGYKFISFDSDLFRPFLPDDCQTNPNALGFELADWLARELATVGIVTSYPLQEDWGWFLEYSLNGAACMICCCGRGYELTGLHEWEIEVRSPARLFVSTKSLPGDDELIQAILDRLAKAGIKGTVID
jgi:hypothetical protein